MSLNNIGDTILKKKTKREQNKEEYLKRLKEKRKLNKKNRKKNKNQPKKESTKEEESSDLPDNLSNYEIEYIDQKPDLKEVEAAQMKDVLEYFNFPQIDSNKEHDKVANDYSLDDSLLDDNVENINKPETNKISRKKLKKLSRVKLTDLKEITQYPEIVESWDTSAKDPKLLIFLKSMRNTIPVPKHWTQKRKYLQSQRGMLRQQFKLPDFIEATGISKIRNIEAAETKSLKLKMRHRMAPKLGRMDIDYQVLHDAFFKYQTKPILSKYGDVYYENKEFENKMKSFQPGRISAKLRTALGIGENAIPTFVANMQRYGPPPAYPNLKIPGVNVPILDPTAEVTPNLWGPPDKVEKNELVWDYKGSDVTNHWGELKEEEDEDIENEDDEMGNDQDDLELEDGDEKVDVEGIYEKDEEEDNEPIKLINDKPENPVKNEDNDEEENNSFDSNDKFYRILEQKEEGYNVGELHPVGYKYDINNLENKKEDENNKSVDSEQYFEEEDDEDNNIGKKIF